MFSKMLITVCLIAGIFAQIPGEQVNSLPGYGPDGLVFDKWGVYSGW
jgi:hypothetical protein